MRLLSFLLMAPALALRGGAPLVAQARGTVAFVNASVLPMDRDTVLAGQTVLVRDGIIQRIGASGRVRIPAGATRIDAVGKYLMPGLADVHVHMAGPRELQLELLEMYVVNGVTTILNMRGTPDHLALRADIQAGRVFGPTMYTVGRYVNAPFFVTPDSVEQEVVAQKRAGYDFVKMHGELSREAYARLNAVGRREGIRIIGHAPRTLGIDAVFAERQYALAHAEEFLYDTTGSSRDADLPKVEARIPELARRTSAAGVWLMANLTAYHIIGLMTRDLPAILARPEMRYLPAAVRSGWGPETNPYTKRFGPDKAPGILARHAVLQKLTRAFDGAGVRLLVGTDALNVGVVPGWSAHDELRELVDAGLSPYHALRAATANAGAFLGASPCIGQVRAGCAADLLLLDANPLRDIDDTRRIAGVMVRGRWLPRQALDRMLDSLAPPPPARQPTPPARLHEYTVDAGHSPVEFSIGFALTHVKGRFTQWKGTILYDSIEPANSSITAIFETRSLDTGWGHRDEHLRTSDFFDVERFPYITFQSERLRREGSAWVAEGPLTMHGVTRTVAIPFRFVSPAPVRDRPTGPLQLHVAGSVRLARTDFGITGGSKYNSWFDQARAATMADSVDISFEIEGWRTDAVQVRPAQVDAVLQRIATEGVGAQVQRLRDRRAALDSSQWQSLAFGQIYVTTALILAGKTTDALALGRGLADILPGSSNAHLALGLASEAAGDRRTALQAYARAKALYVPPVRDPKETFPQDDSNWYYLDSFLRILLEAGQAARVVELARTTAELYPTNGRAHARYGEALALAGRRGEAGEAFARALQLDPMESRAMAYRRALLR